ncbi:MAG: outer membrane beta-barrel protein [Saprospiraceae bacterium]|nr:outer membrane beta-barrel protein [Saprospiraceae bacterium]
MKKQLFLSFLFILAFSAASFAQSKLFAGLDLGFRSKDGHSHLALSPRLGYWLSDNGALVGGINFQSNKAGDGAETVSVFGIGAEYRICWKSDNFYYYLAPGAAFSSKIVTDAGVFDGSQIEVRLTPGVSYMLADKWSISAALGFLNFTSISPDQGDSDSEFTINTNMSDISFGLWYHF